ncbi:MAG: fimbria major subunit [Prevotella sp.]|nr:fimbria major subunit [Prevotella sp.]
MKRKIIERRVPKITAVVDGVLMCMRALSYVVILSTVILLMSACSFDTPWEVSDDAGYISDGEIYIAVTFSDDGKPLKVSGLNTGDEDAISDAHFYFYDTFGNYITTGEITPGNNNITKDDDDNDRTLVVLTGITDPSVPKYILTVLNEPEGFNDSNFKQNLDDIQTMMSTGYSSGIYQSDINAGASNYIMSTSTYPHTDGSAYDFATYLTKDDFNKITDIFDISSTDDDANVLTIPVERLAAKVTVKLSDDLSSTSITTKETVDDVETIGTADAYSISGGTDEYIELKGWKLNAISRETYMFKNIGSDWDDSNPWNGWKDTDGLRCHWAMSPNYGDEYAEYPESNYNKAQSRYQTEENETSTSSSQWLNQYLRYVSLSDDGNGLTTSGSDDYCAENTNTADVLDDADGELIHPSAITSVIVKARAWKEDSENTGQYLPDESAGTDGYMYYNIPIMHKNGTEAPDWEYGVVRNHRYTIKITGIEGKGTGIDNLGYVIVPIDGNLYFTAASLKWSVDVEEVSYKDETIDVN